MEVMYPFRESTRWKKSVDDAEDDGHSALFALFSSGGEFSPAGQGKSPSGITTKTGKSSDLYCLAFGQDDLPETEEIDLIEHEKRRDGLEVCLRYREFG